MASISVKDFCLFPIITHYLWKTFFFLKHTCPTAKSLKAPLNCTAHDWHLSLAIEMFYINTSFSPAIYLRMLFWYFLSKLFCFHTTRIVQVFIHMRSLDSLGCFPHLWHVCLWGWFIIRWNVSHEKRRSLQLQARTASIKPALLIMQVHCWSIQKQCGSTNPCCE